MQSTSGNGTFANGNGNGHGNGHGNGTPQPRLMQRGERWEGIRRDYTFDDVKRLRGTVVVAQTLAELGAERLWSLLHERDYVQALGALTGNQAVQMVKAGLDAIYLSG